MRFLHIAAIAALAASLPAQRGTFAVYPDDGLQSTSFIDRGLTNTGGNAGEVLNELPLGLASGIGQIGGGLCKVKGLTCVLQDQNAATPETFSLVARPRAASGTGPDPATVIFRSSNLQTPTATGGQAWLFTLTFQTPVTVPCDGGWFYGIALPAAPTWPNTDGLSIHMAHYTQGTLGDHPRTGAPMLGASINSVTQQVGQHDYVFATALLAEGPTLQVGAVDPQNTRTAAAANQGTTTFGAGGFYPDVSRSPRSDGLEVRFFDAGAPGAITAILFAFAMPVQPLPIIGVTGELRLDPATLFGFPGAPLATAPPERAIPPFLPAGSLPTRLAGSGATVFFQGVVLDPVVGLWLTNAVGVRF